MKSDDDDARSLPRCLTIIKFSDDQTRRSNWFRLFFFEIHSCSSRRSVGDNIIEKERKIGRVAVSFHAIKVSITLEATMGGICDRPCDSFTVVGRLAAMEAAT